MGIYTFATDVLIAIRYESPLVQGAPDVSGHDQALRYTPFWDIFNSVHSHFGTCPIRNIVTSGQTDSGLHNSTISSYNVQAVRTVQATASERIG